MEQTILLQGKEIKKAYPSKQTSLFSTQKEPIQALRGVDFQIEKGKTCGLVGESGSGKSTLSKIIVGMERPDEGELYFDNQDLLALQKRKDRTWRKQIQMVFQNPYESLNPRNTIEQSIAAPFEIFNSHSSRLEIKKEVKKLLAMVELPEDYINRYPHELSGGQRQRVGIARAIALKPQLIICDEAVSALDVSIQSQILILLKNLQKEFQLTYLFISHDLSVVENICESIYVMRLGKIVESGSVQTIFSDPKNAYTKELLSAIPVFDPEELRSRI